MFDELRALDHVGEECVASSLSQPQVRPAYGMNRAPAQDMHAPPDRPLVFINYRGADNRCAAVLIYTTLANRLGHGAVFLDYKSILPGQNVETVLMDSLRHSAVVLALIGERWFDRDDAGRYLLDKAGAWVRKEILEARDHSVPILPVLLGGVPRLGSTQLPSGLEFLGDRPYHTIHNRSLPADVTALADRLEREIPRIRKLVLRRRLDPGTDPRRRWPPPAWQEVAGGSIRPGE